MITDAQERTFGAVRPEHGYMVVSAVVGMVGIGFGIMVVA
jgi:hypothetical protein